MARLGRFLGPLGASWGLLGASLNASWAILEPSWAVLGPSWKRLRLSWKLLKPSSSVGKPNMREPHTPSNTVCNIDDVGLLGLSQEASCGGLGAASGPFGLSWNHLRAPWNILGLGNANISEFAKVYGHVDAHLACIVRESLLPRGRKH